MKKNKVKLFGVLLFSLMLNKARSQQVNTASGGDASGSGGKVAYSLGQINLSYINGNNGNLNQGVQQPYEIFNVNIKEENLTDQLINLFPNPVSNQLTLEVKTNETVATIFYQLNSADGKLLLQNETDLKTTNINMEQLPAGNYFLCITQKNKLIKTFNIIKN